MGVKAGEQGLKRYVAAKRLARVRARIQRSGAVALAEMIGGVVDSHTSL